MNNLPQRSRPCSYAWWVIGLATFFTSLIVAPGSWAADRRIESSTDAVKKPDATLIPARDPRLVQKPPTIKSFNIQGGAQFTAQRQVVLDNATSGATHFRASQSSATLNGAAWQVYSPSPSFNLSAGNGTKNVYLQLKNAAGVSAVRSDSITLMNPRVVSLSINNGGSNAAAQTVSLNNSIDGVAAEYRASENLNFAGASWQSYSSAPQFELSSTLGTKTIYFQTRSGGDLSNVLSDTIEFAPQTEYTVNANAALEYAETHGFSFNAEPDPASDWVSCEFLPFKNEIRAEATFKVGVFGISPGTAICRFELFQGKLLNPPWLLKKVEYLAAVDIGWIEEIKGGTDDASFSFRLSKPVTSPLAADLRFYEFVLVGPEGAAWEDAFE